MHNLTKVRSYKLILIGVFLAFFSNLVLGKEQAVLNSKIIQGMSFNKGALSEYVKFGNIHTRSNGRKGYALDLKDKSYLTYQLKNKLSLSEGSIELWVFPEWKKGQDSHTFLTFRWNDNENSYMALSNGWWEPKGKNRLYFILSNQDFIGCSSPDILEINKWNHLVLTWKSGENGECKLFLNGSKLAHHKMKFNGSRASSDTLFIGSDKGSTEVHKRKSDFMIDELNIYSNSLSDKEAVDSYKKSFYSDKSVSDHQWSWLNNVANEKVTNKILTENRVVFDEAIDWATSKEVTDEILNRIKNAGFNVYVPCVWHGRGTYYPSSLYPLDARLKNIIHSDYDPLEYLITKAHSMGIEVHPWFTVVRRERNILPEYAGEGVPELAFNIHNKKYRKFIVDLMLDVVKRYDVDGINLDYIRSMGICMSEACKDDYFDKYDRSLFVDKYASKIPKYSVDQVREWNNNAVTDIVKTFSKSAKLLKKDLIISVDSHPLNSDLLLQGQDSLSWANNGYIDIIFNMDYKQKINMQSARKASSKLLNKNMMIMLLANYDKLDKEFVPRSGMVINGYVEYMRSAGVSNGLAFYMYARLTDEHIKALKKGVYMEDKKTTWSQP